jgi:transcriptional regulator with XRE-family HTH domain
MIEHALQQVHYLRGNGAPAPLRYRGEMAMAVAVGDLLREWRQRRRVSQLDLAGDAEISTRHLSFIETGRSTPSREVILRLADQLEVPLRARNTLLTAAGYAPVFVERSLDDPALALARQAIERLLTAHEPFPAIAVDRHWTLVAGNRAASMMMTGADAELLKPPVNVLRLSLHPKGLASRIENLEEWRTHVLGRLRRQVEVSADPTLVALLKELSDLAPHASTGGAHDYAGVLVPLRFATDAGVLSFFSTTTIFGTPVDITLSEIALESFFPADAATAEALRVRVQGDRGDRGDRGGHH